MDLFLFSISLVAYFALHSFLAAKVVKDWLTERIISPKLYRLFFNALAIGLFLVVGWYYLSLEKHLLLNNDWLKWPGGVLLLAGLVWVIKALRGYGIGEFIGVDQLKNEHQSIHIEMKINGLNAQVRHPLYFGTMLSLWGVFFIFPNDAALVVAAISTLYIIIGAKLEERKLEQQFGDAYRLYRKHVPMLVPFRWSSGDK